MKKIFLSIFIVSVVCFSCSERNNDFSSELVEQNTSEFESQNLLDINLKQQSDRTTFYDNGGSDYGCDGPPADCIPEITIEAEEYVSWREVFWLWLLLESWTQPYQLSGENPYNDIEDAFTVDYALFCDVFTEELVDGVLDDTYTIDSKGDGFEDDKIGYIIFKDNDDDIVEVHQHRFLGAYN